MARTHLGFVILAGLTLFAREAAADEPRTLFGQPVNQPPELTEEELADLAANLPAHLEKSGLRLVGGNQIIPERLLSDPPEDGSFVWDTPPHRATTFLNFFGGPLKYGTNASEGQSPCVQGMVNYPGFGGTEQKALAIIQVFKDAAAPFGMRIAYDAVPPKHLPHSQVMMGGKPGAIGLPQGVLGVACNLDCGDLWWRDTTFAFTEETNDVPTLGTTALQEAAHAWGLDHIDGENNIMFPYATPGIKVWADTCTPYNDATGQIGCEYVHKEFCPEGSQNDVSELMAYFGANTPDTVPPTVVMSAPMDGQVFEAGAQVNVAVEVSDDFEGYGWRLMIPELDQEVPVYDGTKNWGLKPPKGEYTIRVEAIDHDRNIGFAEAKIYVGVEPPPPEPMTTSGGEDETGAAPTEGGGSEGGGSEGGSGATMTTAPEETGDDKGCSCRTQAPAPWLLGLGLLAVGARRRRR